jgi:hypothetical protein
MLVSLWRQEIPCLGELGYEASTPAGNATAAQQH